MSDSENSENDYYGDSDVEDVEEQKKVVTNVKLSKPVVNHAKKFGDYKEDDSEPDDADVEDDDDDAEDDDDDVEDDVDDDFDDDAADDADSEEQDDSDIEIGEDGEEIDKKTPAKINKQKKTQLIIENDDDEDDEYEENYLQKFDYEVNKNYITEFHPECLNHNNDEVQKLAKVVRDENNIIIDPLHRTLPHLTKYEKARILGQRAKQIEVGSKPLVKVPETIIDSYIIAELELRENKIPFIIKRPIPGGAFEYWHLRDLENINF